MQLINPTRRLTTPTSKVEIQKVAGDDPYSGYGWDLFAKAIKKKKVTPNEIYACMYAFGYHWSTKKEWVSPKFCNAVVRRVFSAVRDDLQSQRD